ncbi:hypothetical protein F8M41_001684 [Gigaspora margarita]|uniref:Uncharacterized protein n=1 Tax=Gigaspora margarita TaxID=4874 RepID=A0A8H3XFK5_GIGMA|nr:hypothetical protein F8M41_001684 [Gigaspora margarita]
MRPVKKTGSYLVFSGTIFKLELKLKDSKTKEYIYAVFLKIRRVNETSISFIPRYKDLVVLKEYFKLRLKVKVFCSFEDDLRYYVFDLRDGSGVPVWLLKH